jgi:AAA15 family ATPase/GTPase
MLLEFSVTNFRSIQSRQTLSLIAGPAAELARDNVCSLPEGGPRVLRSAVIYGPNASGKSNLLRALQTLGQLVRDSATKVQEGDRLNLIPFVLSKQSADQPSDFEIIFIADDGVRYHYGVAVTPVRVIREWMVAYPEGRAQRWFEREYSAETDKQKWWFGPKFRGEKKTLQDRTRNNGLFLSSAINLNNAQLRPAFSWLTEKLIVLVQDVGITFNPMLSLDLLRAADGDSRIMQYMKSADIGIDRLELLEEDLPQSVVPTGDPPPGVMRMRLEIGGTPGAAGTSPKRFRVRTWHSLNDSPDTIPLDLGDESAGTQKLFEFAGGWIRALEWGATLFVDELDRSLHPHVTRFLVGLFHGAANRKNAQLIFTTHDTTLLDTRLMRRDQIWFVEKDSNKSSHMYSLLDFQPRKDEALERGYLRGRYGAIPFIGRLGD